MFQNTVYSFPKLILHKHYITFAHKQRGTMIQKWIKCFQNESYSLWMLGLVPNVRKVISMIKVESSIEFSGPFWSNICFQIIVSRFIFLLSSIRTRLE